MKLFAQVIVVLILVTAPAVAQPRIRLGAWNIEHLGNPTNRPNQPTPANLARYIIASEVDVLGLEEVTQDLAGRRNATLQRALEIVEERTGEHWEHVLFQKSSQHQHIGVAWNTTRARRTQGPLRIDVPASMEGVSLWDRHPHAVKFSFGDQRTDIVVVVLHMKANTATNNSRNVRRRALEARTLVAEFPVVRDATTDEDLVLIGDTNILRASELAAQIYVGADLRDLNSEDEATFISASGPPFDRTFVPRQPEFANLDQVVFDTEFLNAIGITRETFRRRFSDHFMIVTEVRVTPDDD